MFTIGLDYGTNTVRAIIVNSKNGELCGSSVFDYKHGQSGVISDPTNPNVARQHPADYIEGLEFTVKNALKSAGINNDEIIGIGIDATASTPIPLDDKGVPLAFDKKFEDNLSAMAWLWKDHTSIAEAKEITELAQSIRPQYLSACGGTYSSEWYWAKVLHCARNSPDVFNSTSRWIELSDFIPYLLTGQIVQNLCAAGHKGLYSPEWNGFVDKDFLNQLDPSLISVRENLSDEAFHIGTKAGSLNKEWADKLGLKEGISVAVGNIDAHAGAVGSGVKPGTMIKVMGTSTCDIAVAPLEKKLPDIPGICGVAHESVLPGCYGLEAGQSAVGDIFNWFVNVIKPDGMNHDTLNKEAEKLKPGESGLLALDWHNGNRCVLTDSELTGMVLGLTLHSKPSEIFRAHVEATAFGARLITDRYRECGVPIDRIITCGGIAQKSPMTMQIYADVLNCIIEVSLQEQSCALGSAMAAAVVGGAHSDFESAAEAMIGEVEIVYTPNPDNVAIYNRLFDLYTNLHDLFGTSSYSNNQYKLMKELILIREQVRND